jgi:parallel beta-helix repeat protein
VSALDRDQATIEIAVSTRLDPHEKIVGRGFLIRNSNVTLDCGGAVVDGAGKVLYGVQIDSQGRKISNIVVKNCVFENFKYDAVNVGWILSYPEKGEVYKKFDLYDKHPENVLLLNNKYLNSGNSGVYINAYSQHVTVRDSYFSGNDGPSIYLDFNSRFSAIQNSVFEHNGFGKTREAIAIDSATNNLIEDNVFSDNYSGSIFLYKNCGERRSLDQVPIIRSVGANYNIIKNNIFKNEKVGVWIAARQSHDLSKQLCADSPIVEGKYFQDYASGNKVIGNSFCGAAQAVIVEDDNNVIENNRIDIADLGRAVRITNPPRAVFLHKPVVGNVVSGNVFVQCN